MKLRILRAVGLFCTYLLLFWSIGACHKENFTEDPGAMLRFEQDTLSFDTVFTSIGSATRVLKVYNPNKQSIRIDRIYIPGANPSEFNFNIDGLPGNDVSNLEIRAEDSIYLFCEVRVNPNDPPEISPYIKLDSIVFEYNSHSDRMILMAFGQNANYFPSKAFKGQAGIIDLQGGSLIWDDPKPYIFYGVVYIDHGSFIIKEGTRVHFWGGLTKTKDSNGNDVFYNDGRLIIGADANLQVTGSKARPVIFEGVRLEPAFKNTSGQWSGIFFDKGSKGNSIEFAEIKNNLLGVYCDSIVECNISNTKIYNNSLYGVYASSASVKLANCLFYNQGLSSINIETGGTYAINYCSLVNFGNTEPALFLSNSRCIDFPFCEIVYEHPLHVLIQNSVITGSDRDELWMNEKMSSAFKPFFKNCLFRIDELIKVFPDFNSSYTDQCEIYSSFDHLFKDISKNDFHPDTLSVLEMKALVIPEIDSDLDGVMRDLIKPDIGCYEYILR